MLYRAANFVGWVAYHLLVGLLVIGMCFTSALSALRLSEEPMPMVRIHWSSGWRTPPPPAPDKRVAVPLHEEHKETPIAPMQARPGDDRNLPLRL